jgi:beta-lactamase superfamily II metal-dependent hydrolase
MYRVGFGDFFLLTVPGKSGPANILIDCGVHAGNIGSIGDCVQDLVKVTGRKLALVIVTHFHADHLSGFATQSAEFAKFQVGAVWITNRLDPGNAKASHFKQQITSVARQVHLQLGAAGHTAEHDERMAMAENALGVASGSNDAAMKLVTTGFSNKPPVYYYEGGNTPTLPAELEGMITARILGPAPLAQAAAFSATDNKKEQYITGLAETGVPDTNKFRPFEKEWPASSADYPPIAWSGFDNKPANLEKQLEDLQPDLLAAAANAVDGTLNNQSLVVLFTCKGKNLLFVGDAQWGNWSSWLYGKAVTGSDPGITADAKKILGSLDFYKVGHHGSTNATPIPASQALTARCVGMCSTEPGCYGSVKNKSEVPREPLMEFLEKISQNKVIRSDRIPYGKDHPASDDAVAQLKQIPSIFSTGPVYIDYEL